MTYTRREFGRVMIGTGSLAVAFAPRTLAEQRRPDSRVAGVQLGLNVPYSFGNNLMRADDVLKRCLHLGVSAVELRSQPVERWLGASLRLLRASQSPSESERTPERLNAQREAREALRAWRLGVSMDRAREFRREWRNAGMSIEIVKFDDIYVRSDEELDYCFMLAKALGARAISCEIDVAHAERLGHFADRHRLMVGYHGHAETGPEQWLQVFGYSKYNGANLDIGHYLAGGHTMPIASFLATHHDRVTHIHVKDRKASNGPNVPFGTGDTPIGETLRLIRDRKWRIQATIEFEYPVPEGSDRMLEIAKCVEYCRRVLAV